MDITLKDWIKQTVEGLKQQRDFFDISEDIGSLKYTRTFQLANEDIIEVSVLLRSKNSEDSDDE